MLCNIFAQVIANLCDADDHNDALKKDFEISHLEALAEKALYI